MAQKYYNSEEAAGLLGVSSEEVKQMAQSQQLHGYRDGAEWKFKVEEVEQFIKQRAAGAAGPSEGDEGDVLMSELELGPSESGSSGTVIGGVEDAAEGGSESDLRLAEEPQVADSGPADAVDSKVMQFEQLDLELDEELTLEDSNVTAGEEASESGSTIQLATDDLDDDDVVLGGSGSGSDITIGGDSGISLVDPGDSGLSLEEPLELAGSASSQGPPGAEESLALGEDDMIDLEEAAGAESATGQQADDDFSLTPLEEAGDEEDSESGSQVIALDIEEEETAATVIAGTPQGTPVDAMLDEDLGAEPMEGVGLEEVVDDSSLDVAPLAVEPGAVARGVPLAAPAGAAAAEVPYTTGNIVSLSFCTVLLILVGMMMFDLMRNMWSWNEAYRVNSFIMDTILNLF